MDAVSCSPHRTTRPHLTSVHFPSLWQMARPALREVASPLEAGTEPRGQRTQVPSPDSESRPTSAPIGAGSWPAVLGGPTAGGGAGDPPNWARASGALPGSSEFTNQRLVLHMGQVKASAGRRYLQGSHEESRVLRQRQAQTVTAPGICPHWRQSQGEARS